MKEIREYWENKETNGHIRKEHPDYKLAKTNFKKIIRILDKKNIIKPTTIKQDPDYVHNVLQKKENTGYS